MLPFAIFANSRTQNNQLVPVTIYNTKDGLPSSNIQDIIQEEKGFLWLATQEGLSRFDSFEFQNYTRDKSDASSLPDILIEDLLLMPNDELWMSIYEVGISVFDKYKHQTSSIKNNQSALFQLPNSNLYGISKDQNNNVWFSLYGEGIYQWNTQEKKFYKHLDTDENAWLSSKMTFEIMVDSKNRLWVCTIDSKVYYYNIDSGDSKVFDFSSDPNDSLSSPIYGFTESAKGEVFAGGYSGVFKYNEEAQSFDQLLSKAEIASNYQGVRTSVRRLMMDSNNNLWIGTTRSLLKLTSNELRKVLFFENGDVVETSDLTIHAIIEGYDGNIWIGTEGLGLVKIAADWNRYNIYISHDKEPIDIRRAYQYGDNIWIVRTSSNMDLLEVFNGEIRLKAELDPKLIDGNIRIGTVYQENPNEIWLSSVSGINKIDTRTGDSTRVVDEEGKKLGSVRPFYKAKDKQFYFNFFGQKVIGYFNEDEMVAHKIPNSKDNHFKGSLVYQIVEGLDGKIWFATDTGIESLDINNHQFSVVFKAPNNLSVSNLYFQDNQQDVWMIADGGLYHLLWLDGQLIMQENMYQNILPLVKFGNIENLENNVMLITTEDHGLVELNVNTLQYTVYTKENGLPSDVIKKVLFPKGIPLVVTESGLALYNYNFVAKEAPVPRVIFDGVTLDKETINPNTKDLVLEHDYGALNFDMALLSFGNSTAFEYEYLLKGASDNWQSTGNDDKYSFFNLNAGKYDFRVRGRSNYGQWSEVQSFPFLVKPAPWKTWWAYIFYGLTLTAVMLWLLYIYKRKILYEHEITKQQTQKHIANAASKAKSDFLARVSHEVRTPLNGVLGMGELLLDTKLDEEQQIYADSIMASGKHLLDIINDILDLSKIEAGKMELENEPFNLLELVDDVVAAFASQSRQKELLFSCIFDSTLMINRIGDTIRIKQILFNLLSNSFKFTKQGQIILCVYPSDKNQDSVVFKIKDTGIGLDDKTIEDLFKPFVQADSAITRKYGGTGLGLAIVKQLTEQMQGNIQVKAVLNQGSVFEVCLHLDRDSIEQEKNVDILESKQFCVLLQQESVRDSLVEYLQRLGCSSADKVNNSTQCLFVDVLEKITNKQHRAINKAIAEQVDIVLLGFDYNKFNDVVLERASVRIIAPPITYKKIESICRDRPEENIVKNLLVSKTLNIRSLNLLVIEDNSINQQVSIEMLEKMGHWVDIVDSAEEALTMLSRSKYDLLLVDYHLPGMDGLAMIKVWENKNHIPVIVVTADLTDDLYSQCSKLGINNIVAKPFTQQVLSEAIDKAFDKREHIC